jgi:adenosine deaminase
MHPPFPVAKVTEAFIRALPKTETHLHLEGALPFALLRAAAPDAYDTPPDSWRWDFRFPDFSTFERGLIRMASSYYTSPERYHESATRVFRTLALEQNVRYVETSFASGLVEHLGLDGAAVAEAIRSAAPESLEVRVFMGIHHKGYHDGTAAWIDACTSWKYLDGIDLHGPETDPLGSWASRLWREAREAGMMTKAHAGEFDGPAFVRRVVDELGVSRIEHGVRCLEDPDLVRELVDRDVVLDVCPISNVKLGVVPSYDSHPLGALLDAGIPCTVSTDDPLVFGNTLFDEYALLASRLGFGPADLARVAANGFRAARVDESWADARIREIEAVLGGAV